MPTENLVEDVVTGRPTPFGQVVIPRTRSSADLLDRAEVLHRVVGDLRGDSASLRRQALVRELEDRQQRIAVQSSQELLRTLAEAGLAWRDIARLVHVSVPAVQKWRRGGGLTGVNTLHLAKLVALLDMLADHMITDPVSWLEMPVKEDVSLSRLDLLADDRFDLVLELISDDGDAVAVDAVLDEYDPTWRTARTDSGFEAFVAADGIMSIRPRV